MKKLWHLIFILVLGLSANAQSFLIGEAYDINTGEKFVRAKVEIIKNDSILQKIETDFDGNFEVVLSPGEYQVRCKYIGYNSKQIHSVPIVANQTTILDIEFLEEGPSDVVLFSEYAPPSKKPKFQLPTQKGIDALHMIEDAQQIHITSPIKPIKKDTTSQH